MKFKRFGLSFGLVSLLSILSSCVYAATTVQVTILKDGDTKQSGVGTLVADQTVIINQRLIAQGNQILVKDLITAATFFAEVIDQSKAVDLALLSVKGLSGSPFSLATNELETGRKVSLVLQDGKTNIGTMHSVLAPNKDRVFKRIQHTVLQQLGDFGAPLLNNCNELVGISVHDEKGLFDSRLAVSSTFSQATDLDSLRAFLVKNAIDIKQANESCASEQQKLAQLEQVKKEQEEALQRKTEEETATKAELEKVKKEKDAKEKALTEVKKQQEEELAQSESEREKAKLELDEAKRQQEEQQVELDKAEETKKEQEELLKQKDLENQQQEEELTQTKAEQQMKQIGFGLAALVLLVIILVVLQRRRKQLKEAENSASASEHQASVEKAKFETAQVELEQASATFNDIIFIGIDEDGKEHKIKIIGDTLARSPEGILIGRSAQKANYVLNVSGVSREHLRLTLAGSKVYIEDLETINGTAINGEALSPRNKTQINNNDELKVGTVIGRVHFLD